MLAACMAKGTTIIENAAKEPYIVDTKFSQCVRCKHKGAGTDEIKIKGVDTLGGCEHTIIPDQMEAGTYMIAAAASKGYNS